MLEADKSVLLVVDVQGKLARIMHAPELLFDNLSRLIRGCAVLGVPVICTEQNPAGLGQTIDEIAPLIVSEPIPKLTFSCCGEDAFLRRLKATGRKQVVVSGIEAHICVSQTALDLMAMDYEVYVVADAVSSRKAINRDVALGRLARDGAEIVTVEAALFEMLGSAEGERFKHILKIVK
jgi:nicotinamidase-related amidase